jgi:hypothetical protein
VQVEGDVKLEEMDGEENPVDMRNVFPHNTAHKTEKSTNIFKGACTASWDWPELGTI